MDDAAKGSASPNPDEGPTRQVRRAADRRQREACLDAEPPPRHERYEPRGIAGVGGQGIVFRVLDRELGRDVAMKTLHAAKVSRESVGRFLREARATATLEHPNIVPLYDVGTMDDGRPFYTMRLMPGRSLADVLRRLQSSDDPDWSLTRLVQVLQQVALALEFAHQRGVVHRDVKPGNVLLGAHGEVLLVDWGIARAAAGDGPQTTTGVVQGTWHYMSPEQARGERVDARTDVHALGVVLYECLTLRLPHAGTSGAELVASILRDVPPPPEAMTSRPVPAELSRLALRAMAKRCGDRPPSARAIHDELQGFIEGVKDRARKLEAAEGFREEGEVALRMREATEAEIDSLRQEIAHLEEVHPTWQPVAEKRALIDARQRLEELHHRALAEFLSGVHRLAESLAHVPDHAPSRRALADVFWARFREAEEQMDGPLAQVYRSIVERFHDGRFARELMGTGSLRLDVWPMEAELTLHPLVERDLVLVDGPGRPLGSGHVRLEALEMGSYVIVARAEGFEPARYPVAIFRNTHWLGDLRLLPAGSIPDGFVYIPGGACIIGGDPHATNATARRRYDLRPLLVARHPVTFGEYCEFLDAIGADEADRLVPATNADGILARKDPLTGKFTPFAGLDIGELLARGGAHGPRRAPACGIDRNAALACLRWKGEQLGRRLRLLSADEWEAVARGADARYYPWGWRFDASLAHLRETTRDHPTVAPVGYVRSDVSVHGVQDLAGCIQEWTGSWFDEARELAEVRGGGWQAGPGPARSGWRGACHPDNRSSLLGFRACLDI